MSAPMALAFFALCRIQYPTRLNDTSSVSPATATPLDVGHHPAAGIMKERLCLVTQYNPRSRTATVYLGTSTPQVPQRFVAVAPRAGLEGQPSPLQILPRPFAFPGGFVNFSHPLNCTIEFADSVDNIRGPPSVEVFRTAYRLSPEELQRFMQMVNAYRERILARTRPRPRPPPGGPPRRSFAQVVGGARPSRRTFSSAEEFNRFIEEGPLDIEEPLWPDDRNLVINPTSLPQPTLTLNILKVGDQPQYGEPNDFLETALVGVYPDDVLSDKIARRLMEL